MKENEDELTIETDEINCKAVSAWAPEHPTLYQVTAQLQDESGCVIDDLIDRVGFREVKTQGKDILLNGKKLQIKASAAMRIIRNLAVRCRFLQSCRICSLHEIWEQIQLEHLTIQMMSCFLICVMSLVS